MREIPDSHDDIEQALSLERFGRYLDWAAGDRRRALDLYTLNTRLSEALYTPLQMLEVALRNRIHTVMTSKHHDRWFEETGLLAIEHQRLRVAEAVENLRAEHKEPTSGQIVAALTFSFWTSMFGPVYETLWQQGLHQIARREDGRGLRRKDFSGPLMSIRKLRNRVAHHEPILRWDLPKHHETILRLTGWLSPAAAAWARRNSRFQEVHPRERVLLAPLPNLSA